MYTLLFSILILNIYPWNCSVQRNNNSAVDRAILSDVALNAEIVQMLNNQSYKIKFKATNIMIRKFEIFQENKQQYIQILIEDLGKEIDTSADDQLLYGLNALHILASYGEESVAGVPVICEYLNTPLALSAIVALGDIRNDPQTSIPALIEASNSLSPNLLFNIVEALGKYDTYPKERYDFFVKHLNSDDWVVRFTVRSILFQMTGNAIFQDIRDDISSESIKTIVIDEK